MFYICIMRIVEGIFVGGMLLVCAVSNAANRPAEERELELLRIEQDVTRAEIAILQNRPATALKLLSPIARSGHPHALYLMAGLRLRGEGVEEDACEAARAYDLAARGGHRDAQGRLAELYYWGIGVRQDYERAYLWVSFAVAGGYEPRAPYLGEAPETLDPETRRRLHRKSSQERGYSNGAEMAQFFRLKISPENRTHLDKLVLTAKPTAIPRVTACR